MADAATALKKFGPVKSKSEDRFMLEKINILIHHNWATPWRGPISWDDQDNDVHLEEESLLESY